MAHSLELVVHFRFKDRRISIVGYDCGMYVMQHELVKVFNTDNLIKHLYPWEYIKINKNNCANLSTSDNIDPNIDIYLISVGAVLVLCHKFFHEYPSLDLDKFFKEFSRCIYTLRFKDYLKCKKLKQERDMYKSLYLEYMYNNKNNKEDEFKNIVITC